MNELMNGMEEKEELTLEELKAILEAKGLNIKELAREAKAVKMLETAESVVKEAKERKKASTPTFEVSLCQYPDIVIRKEMASGEKLLVLMLSSDSYYVKTVKANGETTLEKLDEEVFSNFTRGMKPLKLPNDFWLAELIGGRNYYYFIMNFVRRYSEIIKAHLVSRVKPRLEEWGDRKGQYVLSYGASITEEALRIISKFYDNHKKFCNKIVPLITSSTDSKVNNIGKFIEYYGSFFSKMIEVYGENNAYDYLEEFLKPNCTLYPIKNLEVDEHWIRVLPELAGDEYKVTYEAFKKYTLYTSVSMGYGFTSIDHFLEDWKDTLQMQKQLYGKIKDKYPKYLPMEHKVLSYKLTLHRQEVDRVAFKNQVNIAMQYEAGVGMYKFIAPKTPEDFYDEATQQNNCLAGYVSKFTEGKSLIFFMREIGDEDKSYVTIETDFDGNLLQAYYACNQPISNEDRTIINKWLEKAFINAA